MINQKLLRAAQSKLAIAVYLGDSEMWQQAMRQIKIAIGANWYRREKH
ncbi:host cell division inhibitory peptide Kil [Salmonella enterica subsp. enterica serovar Hillingdon]|nr:host cell division inhibitory peptide Kil [Salmonella enterica subsp. enterica serovar Louisiana]EBW2268796.1 host cell division inhibitory peptide Kil [Salmonella enterica subsp. enterica serovar Hillingdon]EDU3847348.1 host cell division inhibitory peptide Kil [Salmonella enterica subsp. enterica serovar Essen]EDY8451033.1 host cell division inhibitory peptide Kil [Salmonella enterica subsp. enterica serovar Wangata]EHA9179296.1 host cell division inhibitory peptide Kil [Salmonella enteric